MPTDARRDFLALLAEWAARLTRENDATERENDEMADEQARRHAGHTLPPRPKQQKGKVRT